VLELQGRWQEALASREQAAVAFTAGGFPAEAAAERLSSAAHLRSAGSFRAAVGLLETAGRQARAAGRVDLQARVLGHQGNARARMGEGQAAVEQVRAGLALALEHGLAGPAAEIYQRLADALEHTGDYTAARETYDEAFGFCAANALEPTAQLCLACLTVVLRQTGDWERAAALCRQVIDSSEATAHARTVATGMLGSILGLRGQTRRARPLLLESLTLARRIELAAMELNSTWGLAIVDQTEDATGSAAGHCWAMVERWRRTEDRHYAVAPLRWATTFFAESGDGPGTRTCAAALAQIAADTGQDEAMSALSHALGETALLTGAPSRRPTTSPGPWSCSRAWRCPSTAPRPNAGPRPPWPGSAGARRRWSTWSPPSARPAGWAPGRWWSGWPAASPPWASGPTGAWAGGRSPRRPTAA
jgi:tetratricopeptide (TPR) repeat protein